MDDVRFDDEIGSDVIIVSPSSDSDGNHLNIVDPRSIELPGTNWSHFKPAKNSLIIVEMMTLSDSSNPRARKHVHVNLETGVCTSYVLDRKISDVLALTVNDVERCIEELDMMHVCVGGPPASDYSATLRANAYVDPTGKWRHNGCKIVAPYAGLPCNSCDLLDYELAETLRQAERRSKDKPKTAKRLLIEDLSHRKQSQIIALRKRRQSWTRKKREAEEEMKLIDEMIAETLEEREERDADDDDDEDEDDD